MRLLRHEVLRPVALADREARHTRSRRRKRVETCAITDHVAEVQIVVRRKVMVDPQSGLIEIVAFGDGGNECVEAAVGFWKERQKTFGKRADVERAKG